MFSPWCSFIGMIRVALWNAMKNRIYIVSLWLAQWSTWLLALSLIYWLCILCVLKLFICDSYCYTQNCIIVPKVSVYYCCSQSLEGIHLVILNVIMTLAPDPFPPPSIITNIFWVENRDKEFSVQFFHSPSKKYPTLLTELVLNVITQTHCPSPF